jgi:hypothetical protein
MLTETHNPLVPVYLNQRIVFDLLAMLQDGITTVTKVSESTRNESSASNQLDGSFGLNKAFSSLLSINLSGKRGHAKTDEIGTIRDEERVHTPASLFFKLRELLDERQLLKADGPDYIPSPGDLIEFSGALQRNPVIEAMDIMANVMGMVDVFTDTTSQKGRPKVKSPKEENWQVKEQIKKLTEDLKSGGTIDLTAGILQCGFNAVITAEVASLNDPFMSDLVDGTFSVVGKVVRSVPENSGAINLMRKATMGRLAAKQLQEAFKQLETLKNEHDFDLPDMIWKIEGPVIQVCTFLKHDPFIRLIRAVA